MFDERRGTLLGPPRRFQGCPRWKGLFKESPISIRARWKPKGAHESDGVYHIHISVCTSASTHTHTDASCLSTLPCWSRPLLPLILLSQEEQSTVFFFIVDIHAIWQVNSPTSHSGTISLTFRQS